MLRIEKISTAEGQTPSLKFPAWSWWISEILLLLFLPISISQSLGEPLYKVLLKDTILCKPRESNPSNGKSPSLREPMHG